MFCTFRNTEVITARYYVRFGTETRKKLSRFGTEMKFLTPVFYTKKWVLGKKESIPGKRATREFQNTQKVQISQGPELLRFENGLLN